MKRLRQLGLFLLGALVLLVMLCWAPPRTPAELMPRWAAAPSQFLALEGMQVHFRDEGPRDDALPIVLLHGTSSSLHTWDGWVRQLALTRRVIRLDLPGFGLTGPFANGDYAPDHYVRTLAAFLDALHVSQLVLAGNSFGGSVAWHAALAWPGRVRRLLLIDASGYPPAPQSVPIGFRLARQRWMLPIVEYTLPPRTIESSLRNVYGDPARVTPALVERYRELSLRAGNRSALLARMKLTAGADSGRVVGVKQPTLILWGDQDRLIPLAFAQRFHADIVGSQLVVLAGLGHVPHEEDPARSLVPARAFLALD